MEANATQKGYDKGDEVFNRSQKKQERRERLYQITKKTRAKRKAVDISTILVPHYPQMPPSVKNGDNTGTTLSRCEKNGDITGTTLSGNFAMQETGTMLVAHYPEMPLCVRKMGT